MDLHKKLKEFNDFVHLLLLEQLDINGITINKYTILEKITKKTYTVSGVKYQHSVVLQNLINNEANKARFHKYIDDFKNITHNKVTLVLKENGKNTTKNILLNVVLKNVMYERTCTI